MTYLVGLLYRADWTRPSLTAEVRASRDLDLDRTRWEAGTPPPEARLAWEMATYQLGVESRRSGGAETTVGGRRGYRLRVAPYAPACPGRSSPTTWWPTPSWASCCG